MISGNNTAIFQKQCGFKLPVNILSMLNQFYECLLLEKKNHNEANIKKKKQYGFPHYKITNNLFYKNTPQTLCDPTTVILTSH